MNIIVSWPWLYTVTWEPSKEAVERAANEIHKWLEGFRLSRGAIEDIARAALIAGHEDAPSDLAASECAPSGEPSEEAINKSFEFLNMRLCEFGDKAEMRNLLRAAYAIDAMRPAAITAAVEAEREAIAATHDAEIARLQKQIEENNAYMARVSNMTPENTLAGESHANKFCRDQLRWHERFAASIRARKGEASNGNVG